MADSLAASLQSCDTADIRLERLMRFFFVYSSEGSLDCDVSVLFWFLFFPLQNWMIRWPSTVWITLRSWDPRRFVIQVSWGWAGLVGFRINLPVSSQLILKSLRTLRALCVIMLGAITRLCTPIMKRITVEFRNIINPCFSIFIHSEFFNPIFCLALDSQHRNKKTNIIFRFCIERSLYMRITFNWTPWALFIEDEKNSVGKILTRKIVVVSKSIAESEVDVWFVYFCDLVQTRILFSSNKKLVAVSLFGCHLLL